MVMTTNSCENVVTRDEMHGLLNVLGLLQCRPFMVSFMEDLLDVHQRPMQVTDIERMP